MNNQWFIALGAAILFATACSKKYANDEVKRTDSTATAIAPEEKPAVANGSTANYVAAAAALGCLGISKISSTEYQSGRKAILATQGYTEESWRAASKELAMPKNDEIVEAMSAQCGK